MTNPRDLAAQQVATPGVSQAQAERIAADARAEHEQPRAHEPSADCWCWACQPSAFARALTDRARVSR